MQSVVFEILLFETSVFSYVAGDIGIDAFMSTIGDIGIERVKKIA